jgi:hypothetical protein
MLGQPANIPSFQESEISPTATKGGKASIALQLQRSSQRHTKSLPKDAAGKVAH